MKNKKMLQGVSLALAVTVAGTSVPATALLAQDDANKTESLTSEKQKLEDGVQDKWVQDEASVKGNDSICAVEDGWLHLKAGVGNGNSPSSAASYPAMFKHPNTFDFSKEGYFEFTMKTANGNTGIADCDRFGIYLGYVNPGTGMFVGYDNGGWFWQKYQNGDDIPHHVSDAPV